MKKNIFLVILIFFLFPWRIAIAETCVSGHYFNTGPTPEHQTYYCVYFGNGPFTDLPEKTFSKISDRFCNEQDKTSTMSVKVVPIKEAVSKDGDIKEGGYEGFLYFEKGVSPIKNVGIEITNQGVGNYRLMNYDHKHSSLGSGITHEFIHLPEQGEDNSHYIITKLTAPVGCVDSEGEALKTVQMKIGSNLLGTDYANEYQANFDFQDHQEAYVEAGIATRTYSRSGAEDEPLDKQVFLILVCSISMQVSIIQLSDLPDGPYTNTLDPLEPQPKDIRGLAPCSTVHGKMLTGIETGI